MRGSVRAPRKMERPVFCIMSPLPAKGLIWRSNSTVTSSHFLLVLSAALKHLSDGGKGSVRVMSEGDGGSRRQLCHY